MGGLYYIEFRAFSSSGLISISSVDLHIIPGIMMRRKFILTNLAFYPFILIRRRDADMFSRTGRGFKVKLGEARFVVL